MKVLHCLLASSLAFSLFACGEAPTPLDDSSAGSPSAASPHRGMGAAVPGPLGASAKMPMDSVHAGFQASAAASNPHADAGVAGESYGGIIRLTGERATRRDAYLFVSVVPAGTSMPLCFDRLDLSNEALGKMEGDVRVVPFSYDNCAPNDGDLELKVQFDIDGFVETKNEGSLVGRFPIERGDTKIDVTLE